MNKKAFIFDLDGVIVDTAKYHFLAWQKIASDLGIEFTPEHNEELKGVSRVRSLDIILDLGKIDTYQAAHVPGAIHVPPSDIQLGIPPAPGLLPEQERLSLLFSRLGLTPDTHVVVYDDDGGPWAGR